MRMSNDNMQGKSLDAVAKIAMFCHIKARNSKYPLSSKERFTVPDEKVKWEVEFPEYKPVDYTAESVLKKPIWADPDISKSKIKIKFNAVDGLVNRKSFNGTYQVIEKLPINPFGRTGLTGRGLLGKWGPNHAADPIVTRWKKEKNQRVVHPDSKRPILQFVAIQRKDSKEWAIPGGMVDTNEAVSITLKREFGEEALNSLELSEEKKKDLEKKIAKLFSNGIEIYKGYVDDPRNTDNAWMETVAMNFHDEDGNSVATLPLHAGDDACAVCWMDVDSELKLYASHSHFLKRVVEIHKAHW